jgi:hypothetical protein
MVFIAISDRRSKIVDKRHKFSSSFVAFSPVKNGFGKVSAH